MNNVKVLNLNLLLLYPLPRLLASSPSTCESTAAGIKQFLTGELDVFN